MKRTPLKRKTPMRRVSKKRARELPIYTVKRRTFLARHPACMACATINAYLGGPDLNPNEATQIHHVAKRGKLYTDETHFMAVCFPCHHWIEDHKNLARQLKLLV